MRIYYGWVGDLVDCVYVCRCVRPLIQVTYFRSVYVYVGVRIGGWKDGRFLVERFLTAAFTTWSNLLVMNLKLKIEG